MVAARERCGVRGKASVITGAEHARGREEQFKAFTYSSPEHPLSSKLPVLPATGTLSSGCAEFQS